MLTRLPIPRSQHCAAACAARPRPRDIRALLSGVGTDPDAVHSVVRRDQHHRHGALARALASVCPRLSRARLRPTRYQRGRLGNRPCVPGSLFQSPAPPPPLSSPHSAPSTLGVQARFLAPSHPGSLGLALLRPLQCDLPSSPLFPSDQARELSVRSSASASSLPIVATGSCSHRLAPLAPGATLYFSLAFLGIEPGVHTPAGVTLVDVHTGEATEIEPLAPVLVVEAE